jgi:Glycosyl transferase family 2
MSVPRPSSAHSSGEVRESTHLAVPHNKQPNSVPPVPSTVAKYSPFLDPFHRLASNAISIKLSILMCAYNEERTIMRAITEVLAADYPCDMELIVVDDGSTDATSTLLAHVDDPRVTVYSHAENQGKGAALLTAASFASGTYILPFDADLEYSPEDITRIICPVLKGRCEVVYGTRIFGFNTVYHSYGYAVGNRFLTRLANILFNAYLSDLHTCLKLIPLAMFRSLNPSEAGFGLDTEVTALLLKAGVRPFEVPVSYYSRSRNEGKKISWRDAFACIAILLKVRLLNSRPTQAARPLCAGTDQPEVVTNEPRKKGWRTVRSLGVSDEGQSNAAVTS